MRNAFWLLSTLLFSACLTRDSPTTRMGDPGWVGCTKEEVLSVWGEPDLANEDGGLELWSFTGGSAGAVSGDEPAARLWFDEKGLVSRYWLAPGLARSRKHQPPESCRERGSVPGE